MKYLVELKLDESRNDFEGNRLDAFNLDLTDSRKNCRTKVSTKSG